VDYARGGGSSGRVVKDGGRKTTPDATCIDSTAKSGAATCALAIAAGAQSANDWHPPGAEGNPQGAGEEGDDSRLGRLTVAAPDGWAIDALAIDIPAISSAPTNPHAKPLVTRTEATMDKLASRIATRCEKRIQTYQYTGWGKNPKSPATVEGYGVLHNNATARSRRL
jgi:hypothetical protein